MPNPRLAAPVALAAAVLAAPAAAHAGATAECTDHDLGPRRAVVCTPESGAPMVGLVVALHGRGSSGEEMRAVTELDRHAGEHGYAVVYPDGIDQRWGDDTFTSPDRPTGNEDVEYLDALILDLLAEPHVADEPVAVVGFSNGGSMALRYAAQRPDNVCAVVSVAGQLPLDEAIRPAEFVPLLEIYGSADPIRSYEDGVPAKPDRTADDSTPTMPTRDTVAAFVGAGELHEPPASTESDHLADDDTSVSTETWTSDIPGESVVLHTIDGGGHQWPGAAAEWELAETIDFGVVSTEIDASVEAVSFLTGNGCHPWD